MTLCDLAMRVLVFVTAVALLFPAGLPAAQIDAGYGPLPVFELHSGFWINLHHRVYEEARQQRAPGNVKTGKSGKPVLQTAPGARPTLSGSEQRAWDDAVAYYTANYADKDLLFSTELELLKNQLGDFETCDELSGTKKKTCDAGLPAKLTQVLESAGAVYRAHRWAADDRANRAWIARTAPLVREQGVGLSHRLADIFQTHWPNDKIRVDVSAVASATGAYTTLEPLRVTIASTDARNQGAEALEVLFHEASHGIAIPVEQAIERECRQRDKPVPRDLWHALIFYTTGEVIQPVLESDGDESSDGATGGTAGGNAGGASRHEDLSRRGWASYVEILERYWQPYLDGKVTFDDAIAHMVSSL